MKCSLKLQRIHLPIIKVLLKSRAKTCRVNVSYGFWKMSKLGVSCFLEDLVSEHILMVVIVVNIHTC